MPTSACAAPPAATSASTSPATANAATPNRSRRSAMRRSLDVVDDDVAAVEDPRAAGQVGELVAHPRGIERGALAGPWEERADRVVGARAAPVEDHVGDPLTAQIVELP